MVLLFYIHNTQSQLELHPHAQEATVESKMLNVPGTQTGYRGNPGPPADGGTCSEAG